MPIRPSNFVLLSSLGISSFVIRTTPVDNLPAVANNTFMYRYALIALGFLAVDAGAQPFVGPAHRQKIHPVDSKHAPKYVRFEFDGNPEQMLAEFLKTKPGQDLLQKLLQGEWRKFLDQPPANLEDLIKQKTDGNPFFRELIDKFLKDNPELPQGNGGDLNEAVKKFAEKLDGNKALTEMILKGVEGQVGPDGLADLSKLLPKMAEKPPIEFSEMELPEVGELDFSMEDRFTDWLAETLKDGRFRDDIAAFLKESPELSDAIGDLLKSLQGQMDPNWLPNLPDVGGKGPWNLDIKPPKMPFDLGQLPKLPRVNLPTLPRMNLPKLPQLGRFDMPSLPGFGGAPRMPGAPDVSSGTAWLYVGLAGFGIVAFVWLMRNNWKLRTAGDGLANLLATLPSVITTRSQLRQAFDALALSRLGDKARPWNHRLIASHLAEVPASAAAARALANLYEIARYTPGDDSLSPAECEAVRSSLAALTRGSA